MGAPPPFASVDLNIGGSAATTYVLFSIFEGTAVVTNALVLVTLAHLILYTNLFFYYRSGGNGC